MPEKLIITCAITGAEVTKDMNPALPVTPAEIADAAYDAWLAGASILHLHVRRDDGTPTQDRAVFARAIELVRAKCDLVIECTTGGAAGMTPAERLQPVELKPEMASLDCGTVNFGDEFIVNTLPIMREFAEAMRDNGVQPTLECFDLGHIHASQRLIAEGLLEAPYHYGLVLNVPGAARYTPEVAMFLVRQLPQERMSRCSASAARSTSSASASPSLSAGTSASASRTTSTTPRGVSRFPTRSWSSAPPVSPPTAAAPSPSLTTSGRSSA